MPTLSQSDYVKRYEQMRSKAGSIPPPSNVANIQNAQPQPQPAPYLPPSPTKGVEKGWTPQNAMYAGDQFTDQKTKNPYYSPGFQYTVDTGSGLAIKQRNETIWLNGNPNDRNIAPAATSPMNLTGMATVQDAVNGKANWSDVSTDQRQKMLSDPSFYKTNQITKYPTWMQQQILADPNFKWNNLPKWQEYYYKLSSSPAMMGAAQGLVMGAGNPYGAAVGAGLGAIAGWSGYDTTKEFWKQKGLTAGVFGFLNFAAETAEKTIGSGVQAINAVADNNPNTKIQDVFTKESWNASAVTFETLGPAIQDAVKWDGKLDWNDATRILPPVFWAERLWNVVTNPEKFKGQEIYLGADAPEALKQSWQERMDEARQRIKGGENYRQVMAEFQTGIVGQMSDMAGQAVADPLNVLPQAETKVGKVIAESGGNKVAAEAFTGTSGLGEAARKYQNLVQTGEALKINPEFKVDEMGALSRMIAGVNEQGQVKAGPFTNKGLLDAAKPTDFKPPANRSFKKRVGDFVQNLTNLTPQSRASMGAGMFYENIGALLTSFDDPHEAGKYLKALSNSDMETWKELGSRFAESPEFYTVLPALKDFNGGKLEAIVQAWDLTATNRDALTRISDVLGENPSKLLDDLAARGTAEQDFQRISQRLQQSTDPQARVLLDDIQAGKFTSDTLKQIVDVFTGDGALAWHPGQWKAQMLDALGSHFDEWVSQKLMLSETPEAKSALFRTAALMKQAQSILLLGGSPGYALQNGMSNMVHRAATGIFGYLTPNQINGWMDRFGVSPARMEEGVGIGGMVEQANTSSGVHMEAQTKAGKGKGVLTDAKQKLGKISSGMPFSKLSSWFEKTESKQGFVIGMKQFWNQSWRRGVGFSTMKPELIAAIESMGVKPEHIYAAIEAGMNQGEIEKALYGRFEGVQSRSLIDEAAKKTGLSSSQAADMLDKVGVLDTLDKYLKGQTTQDGVNAAFRRAERVAQDWMDMQTGEDLKAMAEHVKQQVGLEGAASGLDVIQKTNANYFDTWMDHYSRFGDVMNDITLLDDPAMRSKAIDQAYEISDAEFRRINARTAANYKGIMDAWGYSGHPEALNVLQALGDSDKVMAEAYRQMRDMRKGHFEKWKGDFQNPAKWDEWDADTRKIDSIFKNAFDEKARAEKKQGHALGAIYEGMFGPAAGEAARKWWEDTTAFNKEIVQKERDFRGEIAQARRAGVPGDLIEAQKQKYYQETKILQIAEAQKINEEGIARLERVIKQGGSGTPTTTRPTGPTTPPSTRTAYSGLQEEDILRGEAQLRKETKAAKPSPAEEVNTLLAEAEQRKTRETTQAAERLSGIWDVAEEYARAGLPYDRTIVQDKFALLNALRKPEYGGIESLTGLNDERVTPELVRSVMEERTKIKEAEAQKTIGQALANAQDAASNVKAPKVTENNLLGEKRPKTAPGVFTKKGFGIDEMARMLADDGYPIDLNAVDDMGGIKQATALIERAYQGDKVYPVNHDYDAALAKAQNEAAMKVMAESIPVEPEFDSALWQKDFENAVASNDLTAVYEKIGDMPEDFGSRESGVGQGETWNDYVSRVADEVAAKVERDYRDTSIAEAMVRSETAIATAETRAEYATTRNLLKEKFQEVFDLTDEQAQAYMELSDALAGWYEKKTGESGEGMYNRYYKDVVRDQLSEGESLNQGYISPQGLEDARSGFKSVEKKPEWIDSAIKEFGLTENPKEAGYILPDGRMLDFSGKNKGGTPNTRSYDHREISRGITRTNYEKNAMNAFGQSTESLRVDIRGGSEVYVNTFSTIPSPEQIDSILKMGKGTILFDVTDADGRTLVSERISRANQEKLLDFTYRVEQLFKGKDPINEISTLFQQLEPVNRRMTSQETADYARALVRQGADELRRAVQGESVKADRIAILNEAHKLDAGMAENVAKQNIDILFQDGKFVDDGVRTAKGAVTFDADGIKATIHAFEAQDFSTLVHENAHVFRRMLKDVAERVGDTQVKRDLSTIEEWAGVKDGAWSRESEEKFARGFEKYLTEGEAPTPKLKRAFDSFKTWMLQIYKTVTGSAIDVKLTDEVRGVFDRLLGAEEQRGIGGKVEATQDGGAVIRFTDGGKNIVTPEQVAKAGGLEALQEQVNTAQRNVKASKIAQEAAILDMQTRPLSKRVKEKLAEVRQSAVSDQQLANPNALFQDASQPVGSLEAASQFIPRSEGHDQGWSQQVKPLLKAMEEGAVNQLKEKPLDGAMRDMSPEGQKMLRQYMAGVKNDMATSKLSTMRWGEQQRDFAMLNYNKRYGWDRIADLFVPYQFYQTRSLMNWAVRVLDKPAWLSNYARLKMQQQRYERDIPERLRNKIQIPAPWLPDWAGDSLYIDPISNLFFPAGLLNRAEQKQKDINQQELEAERILQEWAADGTVSQNEIQQAAQERSGSAWERALAEAKIRRESDIANPMDFFSSFFGPAWYLSTPLNMAGIRVPGLSQGDPNKVSNLPLTNTARALDTVTQGTWAEPIGNLIGLLGKPEEWARKKAGLPTLGEYGDYYTKRQVANMVAEGLITPEQASTAMIEKQGEIWGQATERVKMEMAMRVPTMGGIYAGLHGTGEKGIGDNLLGLGQAALPTLFGSGLLPEGELEYRGLKQEWNEAWAKFDRGDKAAVTDFFDEHPEYESYLAKGKDDKELMKSFMIGQIWDGYMALGQTNQKQAKAEMGDLFAQAFLNKETRSYESIDTETLIEWAQMLNKMTPSRYSTGVPNQFTETTQTDQRLNLYDPNVTAVTDQFFSQRTKYYGDYYDLEQGYYALPKNKRSSYLLQNPKLKDYWQWKDRWMKQYPELQPILKGQVFKTIDASNWSPMLLQAAGDYAFSGGKLPKGLRKALEQQWILAGQPMDNLDSWINSQVVPSFLYGGVQQ